MAHRRQIVTWDQGWNAMEEWITNLKRRVTPGFPSTQKSSLENMKAYNTVYNMCAQKEEHDHSEQLYSKYSETFVQFYTNSAAVPLLKQECDEYFMLQEFVKIWESHKLMLKWMAYAFGYLDRYYVLRRKLLTLNEVGDNCFHNLVYREVSANVRDAVISLINKERKGGVIDRALLKNVICISVELGMYTFEEDLEAHILKDTGEYYSLKASNWIVEDTYAVYMSKAEECLRRETERAHHYNLQLHTERKLMEIVKNYLLVVYATQLVEKEHSEYGHGNLLTVDNVGELSKTFIASLNLEQEAEDVAMI